MNHAPTFLFIDYLAYSDRHFRSWTTISKNPHHFSIGSDLLPFFISKISGRMTWPFHALSVFTVASYTKAFAIKYLFSSFDSLRGSSIRVIYILQLFNKLYGHTGLVNIIMERAYVIPLQKETNKTHPKNGFLH